MSSSSTSESRIGRLDGIFIHRDKTVGFARLFVVLTLVEEKLDSHNKPVVEPLLSNSPLMKLGKERIIAGLPALDREVPWVTGHRGSETDFICIQSDLQFM